MSEWDQLDAVLSRTMGEKLNEPVDWHPMLKATGGVYVEVAGGRPDTGRPIVEGLVAIVTWAPDGLPTIEGQVSDGTLLVDFETAIFDYLGSKPIKDDWLILPEQNVDERVVSITRIGDDGSGRFYCWCSVVEGEDPE
jgi:hypothetical protein